MNVNLENQKHSFIEEWKILNRFEKIVFITTIFALVISVINLLYEVFLSRAQFFPLIFLLIQNGVLILSLTLLLSYYYSRFNNLTRNLSIQEKEKAIQEKEKENTLETLSEAFHNMSHYNRDLMIALAEKPKNLSPEITIETLIEFCDNIILILKSIIKKDIIFHVAIKACYSREEVLAIARDSQITKTRAIPPDLIRDNKTPVSIKDNTAFAWLLHKDNTVYANDHLLSDPNYHNTSKNWQKKYTSTMVVPIRRSFIGDAFGDLFEIAGFIGVDCMRNEITNIFCHSEGEHNTVLHNILLAFADTIFGILKRGKVVEESNLKFPFEEYVIDSSNFDFVKELNKEFLRKCKI